MKHSVKVKIERKDDRIVVSNDKGVTWEIPFRNVPNFDPSMGGTIGHIASAMLTGTIAAHLKEINAPSIEYTLTIDK